MNEKPPYLGAMPGIMASPLTREPIGTSGELSPGPDELRPEIPKERRELERMGYLPGEDVEEEDVDELEDFRVMDDSRSPIAASGPPSMRPLFEAPPQLFEQR